MAKRIKDKKTAKGHLEAARKALQDLKDVQEGLFEWGDGQTLSEAEGYGEDAWSEIECLGDNLDTVESNLDDFEHALNGDI